MAETNSCKIVDQALSFVRPDRLPVYESYWPEFEEQWRRFRRIRPEVKIEDHFGLDLMVCVANETPPRASTVEQTTEDGLRRERYFVETEPDYWAPVLVNVPEGPGPFPVALCLQGHCLNGKEGLSLADTTLGLAQRLSVGEDMPTKHNHLFYKDL